ncbi:hypothetical protein V8F06_007244 [Rhypophila decipiens]
MLLCGLDLEPKRDRVPQLVIWTLFGSSFYLFALSSCFLLNVLVQTSIPQQLLEIPRPTCTLLPLRLFPAARILRPFLKQPGSPNIPIQAIGLSLYESLPTSDDQVVEEPDSSPRSLPTCACGEHIFTTTMVVPLADGQPQVITTTIADPICEIDDGATPRMKLSTVTALLPFIGAAIAQGVTSIITPEYDAPASCSPSLDGQETLSLVGPRGWPENSPQVSSQDRRGAPSVHLDARHPEKPLTEGEIIWVVSGLAFDFEDVGLYYFHECAKLRSAHAQHKPWFGLEQDREFLQLFDDPSDNAQRKRKRSAKPAGSRKDRRSMDFNDDDRFRSAELPQCIMVPTTRPSSNYTLARPERRVDGTSHLGEPWQYSGPSNDDKETRSRSHQQEAHQVVRKKYIVPQRLGVLTSNLQTALSWFNDLPALFPHRHLLCSRLVPFPLWCLAG